jgi:hypothetical protein
MSYMGYTMVLELPWYQVDNWYPAVCIGQKEIQPKVGLFSSLILSEGSERMYINIEDLVSIITN